MTEYGIKGHAKTVRLVKILAIISVVMVNGDSIQNTIATIPDYSIQTP